MLKNIIQNGKNVVFSNSNNFKVILKVVCKMNAIFVKKVVSAGNLSCFMQVFGGPLMGPDSCAFCSLRLAEHRWHFLIVEPESLCTTSRLSNASVVWSKINRCFAKPKVSFVNVEPKISAVNCCIEVTLPFSIAWNFVPNPNNSSC